MVFWNGLLISLLISLLHQEKNAYYTTHAPMHDSDAPEYNYEHAMEHQHDDYYWRDRELQLPRDGGPTR